MSHDNLTIAIALTLFAAFLLGWFACWLVSRFTRPGRAELGVLNRLAADLHDAEAALQRATDENQSREAAMHERLAFSSSELATARGALQEASEEIEELRAYIERHITPGAN
ncbi:hypothetical protein FQV27_01240 [Paracoccus aurantiacus]|uniref:Uncharacterized protein n=1 Tax=Paracoccus aurantiacus TaxID=2599412 RepID=A0A5C6S7P1_9RHOB|nr:hypothetical protein [Paracoccus aurantiacus]TXB70527.1 hypothetical protein FQV27_01240 [Paracoccus aurantiacus]